ncbi:STAS domain-containing protein [Simplicispira psychrophila]|uniref:STAS domain-containing protein n=1 Tax=Simplicispira psychrophila TaxID=80882 RepID=UPI00048282AB|nr:STAS domain-containing protein [Simplicispira psychrophila]
MLALPAQLTLRQARAALEVLLQALRGQTQAHLVCDASALQVFDSSALAVLLECRRHALAAGKTFAVHALPPALAGMAALYGVAELLPAAA